MVKAKATRTEFGWVTIFPKTITVKSGDEIKVTTLITEDWTVGEEKEVEVEVRRKNERNRE